MGAGPQPVDLGQAANLRDLGGLPAEGGARRLRRGMVYRAAIPAVDDPAHHRSLADLGLTTVVDLRGAQERELVPAPWLDLRCRDYRFQATAAEAGDLASARARFSFDSPANVRAYMVSLYQGFLETHAASFATIFRSLAEQETPLLYHCTAGKDRTGVATALLLEALGTPRAAILDDYLLTNAFDKTRIRWARKPSPKADPTVWDPMLAAEPAYLETAFAVLDDRYGGIGGYLARRLDIGDAALARVRAHLLE
ncbi:tyrosine-protein phosphatase [Novosphingobium bradum]|uniref:Tyrosine-protein phosphatase n=1 Tax=Novosphingobium bradum TaxID=1737444 RepID=A0ABV7IMC5_9SPHN